MIYFIIVIVIGIVVMIFSSRRTKCNILQVIILLGIIILSSCESIYDKALDSYNNKNFEEAISYLHQVAPDAEDFVNAMILLGKIEETVPKVTTESAERRTIKEMVSANGKIACKNECILDASVSSSRISKISLQDTCIIEVDAYLNEKFKGVVVDISESINVIGITSQVNYVAVSIKILPDSYKHLIPEDNPAYNPIRSGMSATIEIYSSIANNAICVPIEAVTMRNEEQCVFVYSDKVISQRNVKAGISDNSYIQITEGLTDGEEVVTAPYTLISNVLKDGQYVRKVERKDLFK